MKKIIGTILGIAVILSITACTEKTEKNEYGKYRYNFYGTFDTMIDMMAYVKTDEEFDEASDKAEAMFIELNALFDKYNDYDGINNIKTINDNAGIKPVEVDERIIDMLLLSKELYEATNGTVNIAMGSVLSIWHDYRELYQSMPEDAKLPEKSELEQAAMLTDINKVIIDEDKNTVFLEEKGMSIDVGAVAKGYATELVAQHLKENGITSFIISSGGNVRIGSQPLDGERATWGVGVQDPQVDPNLPNQEYLDIIFANDVSVVTSGNYQKYYEIDGKKIHHVIDPKTLFPADNYAAVTVVTPDGKSADALSTALYIMAPEEGEALAKAQGVGVIWVYENGDVKVTDDVKVLLKNMGGATSQLKK